MRVKDNEKANLVYQDDLDNLTPAAVMKYIVHHYENQRPRLKRLDRYYQGFNQSILEQDSRRIEQGKADYRATHSFGKYIADFQTSYSVGNPISVKLPADDAKVDEFNRANDVDAENYDLFLDMTRYGRAYEYVYRGKDNLEHLVRLDPLDTFVIYSMEVDPAPIMAVRYHKIEVVSDDDQLSVKYVPETWTKSQHIKYQPTDIRGNMVQAEVEAMHVFPVVEFDNSNFRLGDFENVIPLIDLYDSAQSDTANYMTDLNDAMLVVQGDIDTLFEGSSIFNGVDTDDEDAMKKLAKDKLELLKEMKDANMMLLKSGFTVNGSQTSTDAKYIHKEYDVVGAEAYKKRLASDIHKFSHTPDLTDENFASNASGVAMQYKVLGTVELASTKRRMFEKGLYARYQIVADLERLASSGWKTNPQGMRFTFRDNLPTDDISQITAIGQAGATLPQEYLYQFLPNVTDPKQITELLNEQREELGGAGDYSMIGGEDDGEDEPATSQGASGPDRPAN
ncbi:phage portal protein [Lactiplantibacillus modestisalitolerans]|uniref:Phage portal protein n=1 Tax=Lactiplantibacillus modestisalitolerans TaxID=1457219 RepID=A0ABV5WVS7_9LACO|nr:phage portal protein [Lactiplantibacillus modestisalitolerans]